MNFKNEDKYVDYLCKIMESSKKTPASGAIPGWGGDMDIEILREKYCVEVKKDNLFGKKVTDILDKINDQATERNMEPMAIIGDYAIIDVGAFSSILYDIMLLETSEDDC